MTAHKASILGEPCVNKLLIEHFSGQAVVSFRPGALSNPFDLFKAFQATGYLYSPTATANDLLSHLSYRLNCDRLTNSEADVFECPLLLKDEQLLKMGNRLQQAQEGASTVGRYDKLCVVLIHLSILNHKLAFEK